MTTPASDSTVIFVHIGRTAGTTVRQVLRRQYPRAERLHVTSERWDRSIEEFPKLPEVERARPRLIYGHVGFGLHEWVPRPSTYFTVLRKPTPRVISLYRYVQREPMNPLHETVIGKNMDLRTFVESGITESADNAQTRILAGDVGTPFGACTDEMLARAKDHLDRFFVVAGLTEAFDPTLVLLARRLGWQRLRPYVKANVAPLTLL